MKHDDTRSEIMFKLQGVMASILKSDLAAINAVVTEQSLLREDLGIDSVESLDFLTAIESVFAITLTDDEAASLKTACNVIDLIIRKRSGG